MCVTEGRCKLKKFILKECLRSLALKSNTYYFWFGREECFLPAAGRNFWGFVWIFCFFVWNVSAPKVLRGAGMKRKDYKWHHKRRGIEDIIIIAFVTTRMRNTNFWHISLKKWDFPKILGGTVLSSRLKNKISIENIKKEQLC